MAADRGNGRATGGEDADGAQALIERVQELTAELESTAEPAVRARTEELVAAVVGLYGAVSYTHLTLPTTERV